MPISQNEPTPGPSRYATKLLPPFLFLIGIGVMALFNYALPIRRIIPDPWNWLGLLFLFAGIGLVIGGAMTFKRKGTGIKPFSPITELVIAGPFRFTRNPMYLGLALGLIGVATLMGTVSPFLVVPIVVGWIWYRFIRLEERVLIEQFGQAYKDYCSRVRRWI